MSYDDSSQGSESPRPTSGDSIPSAEPAPTTGGESTPPADSTPSPYPHQHAQHPYPSGPYGYGYPPLKPPTNGLAVASMVVSITALMSCLIFVAPVGLVMGYNARRKIVEQRESGAEFARLGIILGWIGTGLCGLVAIPFLVQLVLLLT